MGGVGLGGPGGVWGLWGVPRGPGRAHWGLEWPQVCGHNGGDRVGWSRMGCPLLREDSRGWGATGGSVTPRWGNKSAGANPPPRTLPDPRWEPGWQQGPQLSLNPPSIPWEVQSLSSTPSQPPHTQGGAPHLGDPPLETPKTRQRLQARRGNAFIVAKASVGQLPAGGGTRPREGGGHGGHRLGWEGARASPQGSPQGPTLCRTGGESSACSWGLHQGGQECGGGAGGGTR